MGCRNRVADGVVINRRIRLVTSRRIKIIDRYSNAVLKTVARNYSIRTRTASLSPLGNTVANIPKDVTGWSSLCQHRGGCQDPENDKDDFMEREWFQMAMVNPAKRSVLSVWQQIWVLLLSLPATLLRV